MRGFCVVTSQCGTCKYARPGVFVLKFRLLNEGLNEHDTLQSTVTFPETDFQQHAAWQMQIHICRLVQLLQYGRIGQQHCCCQNMCAIGHDKDHGGALLYRKLHTMEITDRYCHQTTRQHKIMRGSHTLHRSNLSAGIWRILGWKSISKYVLTAS